jgi:DNA-binding transcriptional LysR family regulator
MSKAAEKLGLSSAAASRWLSALEDRLAVRLIQRTTRRLWLTDAGRDFHRRCATMLAEMTEAEAEVNAAAVNPTGTLRLTSSLSFAMMHIAPALPEFSERYPNLSVQIVTANRYPISSKPASTSRSAPGSRSRIPTSSFAASDRCAG